jgi:hypothetical protein
VRGRTRFCMLFLLDHLRFSRFAPTTWRTLTPDRIRIHQCNTTSPTL